MKVLISYIFCTKGGVETALVNRLRKVDYNKFQIDLHFFKDYGGKTLFDDYRGGEVYIEDNEEALETLIKENKYDIVISIDTAHVLNMLQKIDYHGKVGLEVHTTYEEGLKYLKTPSIDIVDFIIVPSVYQKELVQSILNKTKNIYVLGNAIYEERCTEEVNHISKECPIILWVGRIDMHKNWRLFLQIASLLKKYNEKFQFWVVGGLKSDAKELSRFEEQIYTLDLEANVKWIPQVEYAKMKNIYRYAAFSNGCYISTSNNESFGMTVIEAMHEQCPVVVNAVGALTELVDEGRGLCLQKMDEVENVKKIVEFINSPQKSEIIRRAYEYVEMNYSLNVISEKFEKILNEI